MALKWWQYRQARAVAEIDDFEHELWSRAKPAARSAIALMAQTYGPDDEFDVLAAFLMQLLFDWHLLDMPTLQRAVKRDRREALDLYVRALDVAASLFLKTASLHVIKGSALNRRCVELGSMMMEAHVELKLRRSIKVGQRVISGGTKAARDRHSDTPAKYARYRKSFERHLMRGISTADADQAAASECGVSPRTIRQARRAH